MADMTQITTKWHAFCEKIRPGVQTTGRTLGKINRVLAIIGKWIYRLRGVFLAIPVFIATVHIANFNREYLPEQVGLKLLSSGEYAQLVERSVAVNGPLWLTFACLILMLCSKRPLYPWLISILTLILPLLILATNNFDALVLLFTK